MWNVAVIGIDPAAAKKLAAVVTFGDAFRTSTRTMPREVEGRCYTAFRWAKTLTREYVQQGYHVYVFIEQPVFGRGGAGGTLPIAYIHGALLAGAMAGGADLVAPANNSTWKARVVGHGRAKKPDIAVHVKKTWPLLYAQIVGDQDLCDAACINRYGDAVVRVKLKMAARRRKAAQ